MLRGVIRGESSVETLEDHWRDTDNLIGTTHSS
jgi:hypothetical protein